jgi:hypothetical protein
LFGARLVTICGASYIPCGRFRTIFCSIRADPIENASFERVGGYHVQPKFSAGFRCHVAVPKPSIGNPRIKPTPRAGVSSRRRAMRAAIFERLGDRRVLAAEVVTDLQDYAPGQTAVITAWNSDREGVNFVAGEPFRFQVTRTDGIPDFPQGNLPWLVTDGVGGFEGYYVDSDNDGTLDYGMFPDNDGTANAAVSTTWYVEPQYGDSTLRLHAEGQESGAVATHDFTDSVAGLSIISPSNTAPITVTAGGTFTITYDVSLSNTNGNNSQIIISQIATATLGVTGSDPIPLGGTDDIGNLFGTYTGRSLVVTVPNTTAIGAGTYKLNVTVTQTFQDNSTQSRTASANNSVIIGDPTGAISSLTVGAQAGAAVYGGATDSVTFTVAANRGTNGNINGTYGFAGLPTGVTGALSVTAFTVTGSTALPPSVLTLQVSSTVPAGSYPFTVTCVVGGATVTSSGVLLVNRAPLTVTASNASKLYGNAFTFDNTARAIFPFQPCLTATHCRALRYRAQAPWPMPRF